jgi:hypothetical protein
MLVVGKLRARELFAIISKLMSYLMLVVLWYKMSKIIVFGDLMAGFTMSGVCFFTSFISAALANRALLMLALAPFIS